MSETTPDLRERLLRVAMAHFEEIVSEHDDEFGRFWRGWLREAAAALAVPRQQKTEDHDLGLLGSTASGNASDPPSTSGGWLPIATAPQDEQRVVLFNPDESMGSWAVQAGAHYEQLGGWQYDGQNPAYSNAHPPTHWMPLPPLPHGQDASPQRTEGTKD